MNQLLDWTVVQLITNKPIAHILLVLVRLQ